MKRTNKELNEILDRVSSEIRGESIDPSAVSGASNRVLANLSSERDAAVPEIAHVDHIRGCEDFQLFRRIGDRSEVFYSVHVVLLEFIVHE